MSSHCSLTKLKRSNTPNIWDFVHFSNIAISWERLLAAGNIINRLAIFLTCHSHNLFESLHYGRDAVFNYITNYLIIFMLTFFRVVSYNLKLYTNKSDCSLH